MNSHPAFPEPENHKVKIWKYMDFTKYVSMLENNSLFFIRVDRLNDPFEGSFPFNNVSNRSKVNERIPAHVLGSLPEIYRRQRKHTYVNCWHMNEEDSEAMWSLHSKIDEGVAIYSTFEKLRNAFENRKEKSIHTGIIKYVDYYTAWIPDNNLFYPFMHKRKSYEYEKEVRSVFHDFPVNKKGELDYTEKNENISGMDVPVNIEKLIDGVIIAPKAKPWFGDLVTTTTKKYGFNFSMKYSDLYSEPWF